MTNKLIIYIKVIILYMLKKIQVKMIVKKLIVFFVLLIQEIVLIAPLICILLINCMLKFEIACIQFSVSDPQFSVLVQLPANSNSLYRIPDSL